MKTAGLIAATAFLILVPSGMGVSAAVASGHGHDEHVPVVVCHGVPESDNQPLAKYVRIVVDDDSTKLEGHRAHSKDVIGEPGDEDFQCPPVVVPTPTPTPSPSETTPSPTPTTEEPTVSPTPTVTPTVTPTPSESPTESPTPSATPTPTVTPTASVSPSPSSTEPPVTTPGPTAPPAEHLAKTGVDAGLLIGLAVLALLFGGLLFAASRLRD